MASSITVESLDLGESLVEERDALVTYKRLAEKAGLSEEIATFLVSTMVCSTVRTLKTFRGGDHPSHRRPGCSTGHKQPTRSCSSNTGGSRGLVGQEAEGRCGG